MRILGIDLGSSSIKAVELDTAFGRYDIHEYHEYPILPGDTPKQAMTKFIAGLAKTPDRVIVAIRTHYTTFRNLQLPTRDKKAIQSSVGFELEDELPFPTDESVHDYSILAQSKQGSVVHVAASLKKNLISTVELWRETGINPDVITTEAWAYRTLMNRISGSQKPVLLVQLGKNKTTLYLHHHNVPILIRDINWGGSDITAEIAQQYQVSIEQAETTRFSHGLIDSESTSHQQFTPEQLEFSSQLEHCLEPLLKELKQIELVCKSTTQQPLSKVYISGGGALMQGLSPWLEKRLSMPVEPLKSLSLIATSGVTYSDQADAKFSLAAALTLCLVGPERALSINFRKGAFVKEGQTRELNMALLKKPLMAAAAVGLSLFLSLVVQSSVYRSRLKDTNAQLEKSVKTFFGPISSSALKTYMSNISTLKNSVNKELTKQRELSKLFGPNPHTPLGFLKELSSAIPKDVIVDMIHFQIGASPDSQFSASADQLADITFLVANPQMAEKLANYLESKLTHLKRGKMEEAPSLDGTTKVWKIEFTGKPAEDSFGH